MKKYTLYIICLLLAVAVTSCKKEKEDSFLKGQMTEFHGQKAYIDGQNYSCFQINDQIQVNGQTCRVSGVSSGNHICTISGAQESGSGYYAFYPAGMINNASLSGGFSNVTVTLPRVQTYREENNNQIIDNPMAGYLAPSSETTTIQFNNLCALLKVTVKSNWILDSIQVKLNGAELWGTGTVNTTYWKLMNMNNIENGASHETKHEIVSLKFPKEGISTGTTGKTFYFVVPQTTIVANSDAVTVRIFGRYKTATVSKSYSKELTADQSVAYNTINTLPTITRMEVGVGVFTVNGQTGKKVTFAPGNLVRNRSTNEWHFPGKPYHGVSTASYEYYFSYNNNLPSSNDWGWVNTVSGNPPHTWRVPTRPEWIFILTGNRGNTKNFVYQRVNVTYGLIIFPDNYSGSIPTGAVGETAWNEYDAAGCIFLPAHGYGNSPYDGTQNTHYGYYAMSNSYNTYTNPTSSRYNCFKFQNNAVSNSNGQGVNNVTGLNCDENISGKGGVNVRLVHDIN